MKKQQVDHILRAAGRITGERQFVIIGSQSLRGKYPDVADDIVRSVEVDLIATRNPARTEWLNAIGQDSPFHQNFGYYADPVEETTAILPKGWKERLASLPPGDTEGVSGLCLDPHDLAIAKYVAGRERDIVFNREIVARGLVAHERLLDLLNSTAIDDTVRDRVRASIAKDFFASKARDEARDPVDAEQSRVSAADSLEETRAQGREDWLKLKRRQANKSPPARADQSLDPDPKPLVKDFGTEPEEH